MPGVETAYLSCGNLADKASSLCVRIPIRLQPQALDVRMGCGAVIAFVALDLADLNHLGYARPVSTSMVRKKEVERRSSTLDLERNVVGVVIL